MRANKPPVRLVAASALHLGTLVGVTAGIIGILSAALGALYGYWNTQRSAEETKAETVKIRSDFAVEIAKTNSYVGKIDERVNGIDKAGTDYGRSAYSTQAVERAQTKKDVADMQATLQVLVPTVTEINANVKWLMTANSNAPNPATNSPSLGRPHSFRTHLSTRQRSLP